MIFNKPLAIYGGVTHDGKTPFVAAEAYKDDTIIIPKNAPFYYVEQVGVKWDFPDGTYDTPIGIIPKTTDWNTAKATKIKESPTGIYYVPMRLLKDSESQYYQQYLTEKKAKEQQNEIERIRNEARESAEIDRMREEQRKKEELFWMIGLAGAAALGIYLIMK